MEKLKSEENTWEGKREDIFENLEKKADILGRFYNTKESVRLGDTPEVMERKLDDWRAAAESEFDVETRNQSAELLRLEREEEGMRTEIEILDMEIEDAALSDEEIAGYEYDIEVGREEKVPREIGDKLRRRDQIAEQRLALWERHDEIIHQNNGDAQFLLKLRRLEESMLRKNDQVRRYQSKGEGFKDAKRIIYQPFDVFVIVGKKTLQEMGANNIGGFHVPDSPLSYIREGSGEWLEKSMSHEATHNVLDGAGGYYKQPAKNWNERLRLYFQRYERLKSFREPGIILEGARKNLRDLAHRSLDLHVGELLAALDEFEIAVRRYRPEKIDQHSPEYPLLKAIFGDEPEWRMGYRKGLKHLSTAGKRIGIGVGELAKLEKEYPGDMDLIDELRGIVRKDIRQFINDLQEILMVSKELGDGPYQEAHSLLFLIEPKKIYHIKDYLKYKYSETAYAKALEKVEEEKTR